MTTLAASASILPDELEGFWDDDAAKIWGTMTMGEQTFCLLVLKGEKHYKAYKKAYPGIGSDEAASAASSRMFRNGRVKEFLSLFRESNLEDLFIVRKSLRAIAQGEIIKCDFNGTEIPIVPKASDITAAAGQLSKLSGLNAPETVKHDATDGLRDFFGRLAMGQK